MIPLSHWPLFSFLLVTFFLFQLFLLLLLLVTIGLCTNELVEHVPWTVMWVSVEGSSGVITGHEGNYTIIQLHIQANTTLK